MTGFYFCVILINEMGFRNTPKVRRQGGSYYVAVPKEWLDFWGLKEGDRIVQVGNAVLVLAPKKLEKKAKRIILREIKEDDE